jgi:hypothetical protein
VPVEILLNRRVGRVVDRDGECVRTGPTVSRVVIGIGDELEKGTFLP